MPVDIIQQTYSSPSHNQYEGVEAKLSSSSSNHIRRQPLRVRSGNIAPVGSFGSSTTDDYPSKDNGPINRMSYMESSNNENNKRVHKSSMSTSYGSSLLRRNSSNLERDRDSENNSPPGHTTSQSAHVRSSSTIPKAGIVQRSTTVQLAAPSDEDSVIIEEKRRKLHGDGYTLHRYLRGRMLGKGGFAKVYLCTALDTNKTYAVKIVPKANLVKARARQKLQAEIKIHRTLKHKNVCEYKHFFEDKQNCYILLELCHNQSMNEMIKRRKRLTEPEAAYFMRQLLEAVRYLHDQLVIHRDLKLGNLFLDRSMNIKVGDLGLATKLESPDEKRKTICGTPNYIAPEVIQGDRATRGHSFEVDVWSMGVILFTTLIGKPPYEAKDVKATYQRIIANEYAFPSSVEISREAKDLISLMLQSRPADRPTLDEIEIHPFLTRGNTPTELPSNATHVAPTFEENEFGELVALSPCDTESAHRKICLPRAFTQRRPFANRDMNAERVSDRLDKGSKPSTTKPAKPSQEAIDVPGVVKNAITAVMGVAARTSTLSLNPGFEVFDEGKSSHSKRSTTLERNRTLESNANGKSRESKHNPSRSSEVKRHVEFNIAPEPKRGNDGPKLAIDRLKPPQSDTPPPPRTTIDDLATRAAALTIKATDSARFRFAQQRRTPPRTAAPPETDEMILTNMIERIDVALTNAASRQSPINVSLNSPTVTPSPRGGPTKWVSRYVDYTTKYGLGFLLNDGSSGVYFNDSTKTVLEAGGDTFQYIERKRIAASEESGPTKKGEPVVALHTLTKYPDSLQKKVTLLKHFRNYLIEQQQKADERDFHVDSQSHIPATDLTYLKKWVRTKHAIFFRLSDQTIQIVFYDHSEVLLTPDERFVTYVDKQHKRKTYYLTEELVASNSELAKRLRYTKEILQQLLTGQKKE